MQGTQLTLNFDAITETAQQTFEAPTGKPVTIVEFANHEAVDGLGWIDDADYFVALKSGHKVAFKGVTVGKHVYGRVYVKDTNGTRIYAHDIRVKGESLYDELDAYDFACAKILESALN